MNAFLACIFTIFINLIAHSVEQSFSVFQMVTIFLLANICAVLQDMLANKKG